VPRSGHPTTQVEHEVQVWRRVVEGSEQAECSCGWKGPKRTYGGALAHEDAAEHEREFGVSS